MRKTKRKLFECLGALREAVQANVLLGSHIRELKRRDDTDFICGG